MLGIIIPDYFVPLFWFYAWWLSQANSLFSEKVYHHPNVGRIEEDQNS